MAATHTPHPRGKILLAIEVRVERHEAKNPKKRKAQNIIFDDSDFAELPIHSSPPLVTEKKQTSQQSKLAEQPATHLDRIWLAGDFQRELAYSNKCEIQGKPP